MKFNIGPTLMDRKKNLCEWHRWFAWRPVRVKGNECRWLESIYRKGDYYIDMHGTTEWTWEYRLTGEDI